MHTQGEVIHKYFVAFAVTNPFQRVEFQRKVIDLEKPVASINDVEALEFHLGKKLATEQGMKKPPEVCLISFQPINQ